MSPAHVPTKAEALKILRDADRTFRALLDRLPQRALTTPGIGGGEWSPKELIAHMAFWEISALEAMDAWERGERAPIDVATRAKSLSAVNEHGLTRMSKGSSTQVLARAADIHEQLLGRIRSMPTRRWNTPPTPRGRRPLGVRIGAILGGPGGPFMHANAHLGDLTSFVDAHGS
jgi:DinB superfamily